METELCSDAPGRRKRKVKSSQGSGNGAIKVTTSLASAEVGKTELVMAAPAPAEGESVLVRVVKSCANPRLVACVWNDGGFERRVLVKVKKNANFRCGMELEARRPERESEPWSYDGAMPRFAGRW
jgi:hypothetical protein